MVERPKTVPCKYKTGKTLGQGSYAVVKGKIFILIIQLNQIGESYLKRL